MIDPPAKECNMTDEIAIRNTIRSFIIDSFLSETDSEPLRDEDDLLLLLDSLLSPSHAKEEPDAGGAAEHTTRA